MPDIFDAVAVAEPKADIFDAIAILAGTIAE